MNYKAFKKWKPDLKNNFVLRNKIQIINSRNEINIFNYEELSYILLDTSVSIYMNKNLVFRCILIESINIYSRILPAKILLNLYTNIYSYFNVTERINFLKMIILNNSYYVEQIILSECDNSIYYEIQKYCGVIIGEMKYSNGIDSVTNKLEITQNLSIGLEFLESISQLIDIMTTEQKQNIMRICMNILVNNKDNNKRRYANLIINQLDNNKITID